MDAPYWVFPADDPLLFPFRQASFEIRGGYEIVALCSLSNLALNQKGEARGRPEVVIITVYISCRLIPAHWSCILYIFRSSPISWIFLLHFLSYKSNSTMANHAPQDVDSKANIAEVPTISHAESNQEHSKFKSVKNVDGDTAMALFDNPDELHEDVDPIEARKLLWKIDFMILPYLAVCYAFFYIDKVSSFY